MNKPVRPLQRYFNSEFGVEKFSEVQHKNMPSIETYYLADDLLQWAVDKWKDEVANRPLVNIHRRSLDDTWRQVIRRAGGDPDALVGPSHDTLLADMKEPA